MSRPNKSKAPEAICWTPQQMEQLLQELKGSLPPVLYDQVSLVFKTLVWLMELIPSKDTTLHRLRRWIFGGKSEKTSRVFPKKGGSGVAAKGRSKGHGRKGAVDFPGAQRKRVEHPKLKPGDLCLSCEKGKVYETAPSQIVRISAQPLFPATVFELSRLRCALCGKVFTAPVPPEALEKYDPKVGLMLGLMRFGSGLPHYRMEKMQKDFGVPLPQSTQWELMAQSAQALEPVHQQLLSAAAGGELLHNDDTTMRVQSLKKEKAESERTGIFTSSIISKMGDHQAALFFTGSNHAGENLEDVLRKRAVGLEKPIQMCDALSRNRPKEFEVLLANCLPHGRRNFVDVAEDFPDECRHVLETLGQVFKHDAQAKELNLEAPQRLLLHQEQSRPLMDGLHAWMKEQMDQKKVEPNSGLGKAIDYMIDHWEALTLFLRVPGAPLSNNICERALKMSILHRKNSLSYKTENGARVGDLFMSLIHTCQLNAINPWDYLSTLQCHAGAVKAKPSDWLPWNYTLSAASVNTI